MVVATGDSGGSDHHVEVIDNKENENLKDTPTQNAPESAPKPLPMQATTSSCVTCKTTDGVVDREQVKTIKQQI